MCVRFMFGKFCALLLLDIFNFYLTKKWMLNNIESIENRHCVKNWEKKMSLNKNTPKLTGHMKILNKILYILSEKEKKNLLFCMRILMHLDVLFILSSILWHK